MGDIFEKRRERCFRCGEEEHAERRGDGGGHGGGVEGFRETGLHD